MLVVGLLCTLGPAYNKFSYHEHEPLATDAFLKKNASDCYQC